MMQFRWRPLLLLPAVSVVVGAVSVGVTGRVHGTGALADAGWDLVVGLKAAG